jgi:hypothetical protein
MSLRRAVGFGLRAALVGVCLWYVLRGADAGETWATLTSFPLWRVLALMAYSLANYLVVAWRLRLLAGPGEPFRPYVAAVYVGYGLNNILPAKLGEVAKLLHIRDRRSFSMARCLSLFAAERFCDLIMLLAIGLAAGMTLQTDLVPDWLLAVGLFGLMGIIWLATRRTAWLAALSGRIPVPSVREFACEFFGHAGRDLRGWRIWAAMGLTVVKWVNYALQAALIFDWIAGLALNWGETLRSFFLIALGFSTPSTPGHIGVVEAAAKLALTEVGVDPDRALAVGVIYHLIQFIPVTLVGVAVFLRSGVPLRRIRQTSRREDAMHSACE